MPKGSKTELAYLAGLFDGEGYIGAWVVFPPSRWQLAQARVTIKMCDREGIDLAHSLFGGTITRKSARSKRSRPQWVWSLTRRGDIARFIKAIEPFSRIKGPQFDLFRQFNATFTGHNRRGRGSKVPDEVLERRLRIVRELKEAKRVS